MVSRNVLSDRMISCFANQTKLEESWSLFNLLELNYRFLNPEFYRRNGLIINMPTFVLNTNLPKSQISGDFLKSLTDLLCKILHKPKMYMCVHVNPDQLVTFEGTDEPCGYAVLSSIGSVGGDTNKELCKVLFDHIEKNLGIPSKRLYITYVDLPATDIGWNGNTFA